MLGCSSNKCKCFDCPCKRSQTDLPANTIGDIVKHKPQITYTTNRTYKNGKKAPDGIEVRFGETRPTAEVRDRLKAANFKFSERQKIWYAIDSAKSRAFAEELESSEVEVDNAKYEKLNFWARVKTFSEYEKLFNKTEFQVRVQPPVYYYSKAQLQKGQAVSSLIGGGLLYFKKHYNKLVDDEQDNEMENDEAELLELEAQAELELLKMQVEQARRNKKKGKGLSGIDPEKMQVFRLQAWARQNNHVALDFK